MFKSKIRKISNSSFGCTFPDVLMKLHNVKEGDYLVVEQYSIEGENRTLDYSCGVCGYEFKERQDESEVICPACGELHYFKNVELE